MICTKHYIVLVLDLGIASILNFKFFYSVVIILRVDFFRIGLAILSNQLWEPVQHLSHYIFTALSIAIFYTITQYMISTGSKVYVRLKTGF